jgi:hypothetical protein
VGERRRIDDRFPRLATDGYEITSQPDDTYNCVAWVARDLRRWWHPGDIDGFYWPDELGEGDSLTDYIAVFGYLGFSACSDGALVPGVEKIAVYGRDDEFDHVAFQRTDGSWSSKLGELSDIRHPYDHSLSGSGPFEYKPVVLYMQRARLPHQLAETGLILP